MAIGIGVPLKIEIRGTINAQQWQNGIWYVTDGAAFLTATATGVGEAYWNDIKTVFRAIMPNDGAVLIDSIFVSEPGPTGAYGEYAIPPAERLGTRVVTGLGGTMPQFNAGGIRLAVATRATRPGQKRVVGLREGDQDSGVLDAGYRTLLNNLGAKWASTIVLGAPVATGTLAPIVTRLDPATGAVLVQQAVTGYVTNPNVTSQVSRKIGRGA